MNKKLKIIIALLLLLIIFILGSCVYIKTTTHTLDLDRAENNIKDYKYDKQILNIEVVNVKESPEEIIDKNETTTKKFITLKLNVTNKNKDPEVCGPEEFTLINSKDKTIYNVDLDYTERVGTIEKVNNKDDQVLEVYSLLMPELSKKINIVFEVPENVNISDCILRYKEEYTIKATEYRLDNLSNNSQN